MFAGDDRRRMQRMPLRWRVLLTRASGKQGVVETETENLSSQGFYCISEEPFGVGERLCCVFSPPARSFGHAGPAMLMRCIAEVMRSEPRGVGAGLGCRINEFEFRLVEGGEGAQEWALNCMNCAQ